jgi:PAS domain S-box-containing protein
MKRSSAHQSSTAFWYSSSRWIRWCSLATLCASAALLCVSLYEYHQQAVFYLNLVPSLAIALTFAIFLNIYSFVCLRSEHRQVDQAFRDADCEFSSVFHNLLDGVLIVDDEGICLDANPAASEILTCSHDRIVRRSIGGFFLDSAAFVEGWNSFLQNKRRRGRACLVAGDGRRVAVDFTAASNYLPGRHVLIICDVTERTNAETLLRESEERFQHMANNIQEIFWMMDAKTQEVTYVNKAYATITGYSVETIRENPSRYRELIHPEDRVRVLAKLHETLTSGTFDEEFRFTRPDGTARWIWVKGFPVSSDSEPRWLVGTAQDITSRKQAEKQIVEQLDAVEAARAEAEALRKATLALSQNLAMDSVLDTLLQYIADLVPFDKASVLFIDDPQHLFVAREAPRAQARSAVFALRASDNRFLQKILFEHKPVLLSDTSKEPHWRDAPPFDRTRSWLGIPLITAGHVIGVLSFSAQAPSAFTTEHLRLAKNLAVSAAVAIENARTHERAEIYASELELRLEELRTAQHELRRTTRPNDRPL